jgi:hypothetical protein
VVVLAKWTVVLFGVFIICVGFLMLFAPQQARKVLIGAGSTNFINYAEITIRMIPAGALIVYAEFSRYPAAFLALGWFMLMTSAVLYFVPRRIHHSYSLKSADLLKPVYVRLLAPFAFVFGSALIYGVV